MHVWVYMYVHFLLPTHFKNLIINFKTHFTEWRLNGKLSCQNTMKMGIVFLSWTIKLSWNFWWSVFLTFCFSKFIQSIFSARVPDQSIYTFKCNHKVTRSTQLYFEMQSQGTRPNYLCFQMQCTRPGQIHFQMQLQATRPNYLHFQMQ